ncbi:MAG: hypothetical protein LPH21_06855 [Shewanella sp.]|nr:hypothetical protein [Shewanella sp.]MCF1429905.1 hypothetical protein [Shewanella sp.]MCF1457276.1 hypothetical protein [Shewanella sp.]
MTRLPARILPLLWLLAVSAVAADLPPMVTSYAEKPVQHFNRQLDKARREQASWSESPEQISRHYAGAQFTLIRTVQRKNETLAYLSKSSLEYYQQVLLILTLQQQGHHWALKRARVSWQCKRGQHFSTAPCH